MKHLHKFEAFIIPKPLRKYHSLWKDEDIALQVLQDLKDIKKSGQGIDATSTNNGIDGEGWKFELDGYEFEVEYYYAMTPGGGSMWGNLNLNGEQIRVSTEVCKKIFNLVKDMMYEQSPAGETKKSFRIRKNLI